MKWRHSVLYLLILLLVGGYFYYFEVVKKGRDEAAEKESKRVLIFDPAKVPRIEIYSKDKPAVALEKDGEWRIVEPLRTGVEKGALESFIGALESLEAERIVAESGDDLKRYGLEQPSLKIRFKSGENWSELLLGDKNPLGGGYYAKSSDKSRIALIAEGNWSVLNKDAEGLRRRALFTFQTHDVKAAAIAWKEGGSVSVELREDGKTWVAPASPELKIKSGKVQNVLDQIQWLRAQGFIDDGSDKLEALGLEPPLAAVTLKLEGDKSAELLLGGKTENAKQINALSSELPFVAQIEASILDDLPRSLENLEDRSIFGIKSEDVKEVGWRLDGVQALAIQTDKRQWSLRINNAEAKPLNEPWHVTTLLWDLKEAQFASKIAPPPPAKPAQPYARIVFRDAGKELLALGWEMPTGDAADLTALWIEREGSGSLEAVKVEQKTINKIEEDLNAIVRAGSEQK